MEGHKTTLLERIERDRDSLIEFLRGFIRCASPNPPGDTREAAAFVRKLLDQHNVEYRVIAPQETMPNIVATFHGNKPGRHLALNGHIDVFPVGDADGWTQDPWDAALVDGRIYGRGACDMKCGTTASIFTFLYLHELREELHGRLTLSAVSDEEMPFRSNARSRRQGGLQRGETTWAPSPRARVAGNWQSAGSPGFVPNVATDPARV